MVSVICDSFECYELLGEKIFVLALRKETDNRIQKTQIQGCKMMLMLFYTHLQSFHSAAVSRKKLFAWIMKICCKLSFRRRISPPSHITNECDHLRQLRNKIQNSGESPNSSPLPEVSLVSLHGK